MREVFHLIQEDEADGHLGTRGGPTPVPGAEHIAMALIGDPQLVHDADAK